MLSTRAYNLSVACNISIFSGWENEEFNYNAFKRKCGGADKHYGVYVRWKRVVGFLSSFLEDELERQWTEFEQLEPSAPKLNFADKLNKLKEMEFVQSEMESRMNSFGGSVLDNFAESEALEILLAYSALCLRLSRSETDKKMANQYKQLSLSILLPMSQFCLDEILWGSSVDEAHEEVAKFDGGGKATTGPPECRPAQEEHQATRGDEATENVTASPLAPAAPQAPKEPIAPQPPAAKTTWTPPPSSTTDNRRQHVRREKVRQVVKKVGDWAEDPETSITNQVINIPSSELRRWWDEADSASEMHAENTSVEKRKLMEKVHSCTERLRACFTFEAAEKACLKLSVALIEMAAFPACHDPFSCLQQAALYASQAPKSGNSDTFFRHRLVEPDKCDPLQALVTLGRADCLHSTYFPNEAAYLCSYVARLCKKHSNSDDTRWKIVRIYAFNVSVFIRATVRSILDKAKLKEFWTIWEPDVVRELEQGKKEGRLFLQLLNSGTNGEVQNATEVSIEKDDSLDYTTSPSQTENDETDPTNIVAV